MTRDEAVDLLMLRLGNRTSTTLRDNIISEMVFAQENILEGDPTLPWFLVTTEQTLAISSGVDYVDLPSDFIQEVEDSGLHYRDPTTSEPTYLVRDDWDVIVKKVYGTGKPFYYDIQGERVLLRKTPDDDYTAYYRYYARQTSLAGTYGGAGASTENRWLKWASDWLIAETGYIIATEHLQSESMASKFDNQRVRARDRIIRKNTIMQETNKVRHMEG